MSHPKIKSLQDVIAEKYPIILADACMPCPFCQKSDEKSGNWTFKLKAYGHHEYTHYECSYCMAKGDTIAFLMTDHLLTFEDAKKYIGMELGCPICDKMTEKNEERSKNQKSDARV